MIKINLVREGRAVRGAGAGAAPGVMAAATAAGPPALNNILIIAGLIIGILAAGGWYFYKKNELTTRQDTVASKQKEADALQKIIAQVDNYQKEKDSLQKRIDLINQLKQNQKGPVKIMDRISQDLPDLVWLDKMSMSGGLVTLSGRGLNPNAVANFVDNIKNDALFEEPEVGTLTQVSGTPPVYSFDMTFHFSYAPKTAAGAPGTTTTGTSGTAGTTGTTATSATSTTGTGKK